MATGYREYILVPDTQHKCEIYCHDCGHLRLWLRNEPAPTCCKMCQSENTEQGPIGSPKFTTLKGSRGA